MKRWMFGLVWMATSACSGDGSNAPADVPPSNDATSFAVDERGGSFSIDGVRFAVPPGAVDRRVEIRVTSTDGPAPAGYALRSRLYRFEPEGLTFLGPVQLTIPFTTGGTSEFYWSRPQGGYERLASVLVGATLTASVTHFSTGFVGSLLGADGGLDASVDVPTTDTPTVDVPVVDTPAVDASVVDAPTVDAPLGVVTPARPLLPRTGARALTNRPLVRWALPAGVAGARLTFCRDRAQTSGCVTTDVTGDRGQPASALAAGVWFWSLQGSSGTVVGAARSAVWRLTVPTAAGSAQGQWGGEFDANGDGFADLVRPDATPGPLRIYAGGPAGIATTPTTVEGPFDATGFGNAWAAGDIDADGYVDLAVGASASNAIYVYRGSAAGPITTSPAVLRGPARFGQRLELGDANGDGHADLLTTCDGCAAPGYLFLGSATGLPATPALVLSGRGGVPRFAGDLNGDGREDLLLTGGECAAVLSTTTGAGTSPVSFGPPSGICLPLGDAQNDGYADLAVGEQIHSGGAGGVATTGVTDRRIALALAEGFPRSRVDLDRDGDDDFAAGDPHVIVMSGGEPSGYVLTGWETEIGAQLVGDLNGDGLPDWAGRARVHYSVAGTSPGRRLVALASGFVTSLVNAGDMNGDGFDELLLVPAGAPSAQLYAGTATGYASTPQILPVTAPSTASAAAAGDLDRDGLADALISTGASSVQVVYGASGTIGGRTATLTDAAASAGLIPVGVGDVTGDGHRDVLALGGRGRPVLFLGSATGPTPTALPVTIPLPVGASLSEIARAWGVGDLNADGRGDVALSVTFQERFLTIEYLVTCLGGASGLTCPQDAYLANDPFSSVGPIAPIGDVNGDGRTEIAVGARVYRYDGTRWVAQGAFPRVFTACRAGDQNGDGVEDAFLVIFSQFELRAGAATTGLSATVLRTGGFPFPIDRSPVCDTVGDRDGDGRRELALSLLSSVQISLGVPGGPWTSLP